MKTIKFPTMLADRTQQEVLEKWAAFCEADFADRLARLSGRIVADSRSIVVLSGPSCAGKTTMAHKLIDDLSKAGKRVQVVSLDDFFRSRDELFAEARKACREVDFDSPETLDWKTLRAFVQDILAHRPALLPRFDFQVGSAIEMRVVEPDSYDILLFEGIQGFYRQFLELLPAGSYAAVFVNPESGLKIGEQHLRPHDLRLVRRIVRDQLFRGATPEFTLQLWKGVTENEDQYIFPTASMAHYHLDSFLGYEVCLFKDALMDALATLPITAQTSQTEHIKAVFHTIPSLSMDVLPKNSLLHEFLG